MNDRLLKRMILEAIQEVLNEKMTDAQEEQYKKLQKAVDDAEDAYLKADAEAERRHARKTSGGGTQHHIQPSYVKKAEAAFDKAQAELDAFVKKHRV